MPKLSYLLNDAKACSVQRKGLGRRSLKILEKRGQVKLVLLSWYQLSCTEIAKNGTCPCVSYFGVVRILCCGFFYLLFVCFGLVLILL